MSHVAFDLGLKTTGVTWAADEYDHFICPAEHRKSPMDDGRRQARRKWWLETFRMILLPHPAHVNVYVEAPIMHGVNKNGALELALLHGVLATAAADGGHQYVAVHNQTIKAWAVSGRATKDDMVTAARTRGWVGDDHNEADSYLLWCMVNEKDET